MPRKKATPKKIKRVKKPKTIAHANNYTMQQWRNVVEAEFKPRSWSDWTADQLNNNKIN